VWLDLKFAYRAGLLLLPGAICFSTPAPAQSNVDVRVMAANLNGNIQSYQPFAFRIFQGLKPDIVAIQEFNYTSTNGLEVNTPAAFREMVDTAFGANFVYYREPYTAGGDIPNGIISRFPILNAGSWTDTQVGNRGFAWAQIDLPGTNDLYIISVHLLTSSSAARGTEAGNLKTLIQASFPTNAWIVVAGDFNTDSRTETPTMTTFDSYLSDHPVPVDDSGNSDTSLNRNHPHDYVLPSFPLTNLETDTVFPTHTYPNGLVFDSRVYSDLSDFAPVQSADSGLAQHMAVMKDFTITIGGTNAPATNAPSITTPPQSQTVATGSNAVFTAAAGGTAPLSYQWLFNGTNISGANTTMVTLTNVQFTNAGNYSILVTNLFGSVTSSIAALTVSNFPPVILAPPQGQTANAGGSATFTVNAGGSLPLAYQWLFNGTNNLGLNTNAVTLNNVQTNDAGNYSVVITNAGGGSTSAVAVLTVNTGTPGIVTTLAGWDVNALSGFGPSPMTPTTNAPNLTIVGLTRGNGVTTNPTAAGRAWGGNGFDASNSTAAIAAGDYAWFSISANAGYTVSFTAISRFDYRRSSTGPPYGVLQFQIGSGIFTNIANLSYPTAGSGASLGAIDLSSLATLQNIGAGNIVTFRIVNYGASGSGGTWYIYDTANSTAPDFVVQGIINSVSGSTNPPAIPAVLSAPILGNGQFQMLVTGSADSNYVMLAATNLTTTTWTPLFTNVSPYIFTDADLTAPQKFYRATVRP
jgi:endonuclease/exonuclease/phosphatase family metal-dependent hydrolase